MTYVNILNAMFEEVQRRRAADPAVSYTARLFAKGKHKVAQKFGEEAVEAVIAAVAESDQRLARESADVLYHLLVLWAANDIDPEQVWIELEHRFGAGPAIKEQRPQSK